MKKVFLCLVIAGFAGYAYAQNLIENSSFELGLGHGWGYHTNTGIPMHSQTPDSTTAAHGKSSFHWLVDGKLDEGKYAHAWMGYKNIKVKPGVYTLSFYAKTDTPGLIIKASSEGASPVLNVNAALTKEWKRYSVTGNVKHLDSGCMAIIFRLGDRYKKGNVWIDAVSLQPGKLTDYKPRHDIEQFVHTDALSRIFLPGKAEFVNRYLNNTNAPAVKKYRYTVYDFWNKPVWTKDVSVELKANQRNEETMKLPLKKFGAYRMEVSSAGEIVDEIVFSILPPERAELPADKSLFGTHIPINSDYLLASAKRMGFRWTRLHDVSHVTGWGYNEQEKGKWTFDATDLKRAKKHGFEMVGMLYRGHVNPKWMRQPTQDQLNAVQKGYDAWGRYLPENLEAWENYVRRVVREFKPYIKAWEIWNEPDAFLVPKYKGFLNANDAADYAKISRTAIKAVRSEDPDAIIASLGGVRANKDSKKYVYDTLQAGAADDADVLAYHLYWHDHSSIRIFLDGAFDTFAPTKKRWNTEGGKFQPTFYQTYPLRKNCELARRAGKAYLEDDYKHIAALISQAWIDHAARPKTERMFYYSYQTSSRPSEPNGLYAILEHDLSLRPAAVATAIAAHFIDGAKPGGIVGIMDPRLAGQYVFLRDGKCIVVLYPRPSIGLSGVATVPGKLSDVKFYDIVGTQFSPKRIDGKTILELNHQPIYLVTNSASRHKLTAALRRSKIKWHMQEKVSRFKPQISDVWQSTENAMGDGFAPYWKILAPLKHKPLEKQGQPPLVKLDPKWETTSKFGKKIKWTGLSRETSGMVDFEKYFPADNANAYAWVEIISPIEQDVTIKFGSDDGAVLWLNGKVVYRAANVQRPAHPEEEKIKVTLKKGTNTVVVNVHDIVGGWGFYFGLKGLKQDVIYHLP